MNLPALPQTRHLEAWIKESVELIKRERQHGIVNTERLRQLINTFERRIEGSRAHLDPPVYHIENALSPQLLHRAREVFKLLTHLARTLR